MSIIEFMQQTERRLLAAGLTPSQCHILTGQISDDALQYAEMFAKLITTEALANSRRVEK